MIQSLPSSRIATKWAEYKTHRKLETVLFIRLIIDETFDRNSIPGTGGLHTRDFSKTVTHAAPSRRISCHESRTDAVRSGTFAYVASEIRPRDPLRHVDFSSMKRRWMRRDRGRTSFDSHRRREKSIFFIGENAFRCKGALLRTSNCRGGRLH